MRDTQQAEEVPSDNIPKPLITLCKQLAQAITSIHIAIKHTRLKVLNREEEKHRDTHGDAFPRSRYIVNQCHGFL